MDLLSIYIKEFLLIASLHFLAVASPGPDFAVVSRYSISFGRKIGQWVALGVGTGILLHIGYSILGVALIVHRYEWVYGILLLVGAAYLGWLGWQAIQSSYRGEAPDTEVVTEKISYHAAFRVGFFTNGLNIKATLFFLALFSTVISPDTPTQVKIFYGGYMAVATAVWFTCLARLLTWRPFYDVLWRMSHWIDRVMGAALLLLSIKLILDWLQLVI